MPWLVPLFLSANRDALATPLARAPVRPPSSARQLSPPIPAARPPARPPRHPHHQLELLQRQPVAVLAWALSPVEQPVASSSPSWRVCSSGGAAAVDAVTTIIEKAHVLPSMWKTSFPLQRKATRDSSLGAALRTPSSVRHLSTGTVLLPRWQRCKKGRTRSTSTKNLPDRARRHLPFLSYRIPELLRPAMEGRATRSGLCPPCLGRRVPTHPP